jgi:hypothetical protein
LLGQHHHVLHRSNATSWAAHSHPPFPSVPSRWKSLPPSPNLDRIEGNENRPRCPRPSYQGRVAELVSPGVSPSRKDGEGGKRRGATRNLRRRWSPLKLPNPRELGRDLRNYKDSGQLWFHS